MGEKSPLFSCLKKLNLIPRWVVIKTAHIVENRLKWNIPYKDTAKDSREQHPARDEVDYLPIN